MRNRSKTKFSHGVESCRRAEGTRVLLPGVWTTSVGLFALERTTTKLRNAAAKAARAEDKYAHWYAAGEAARASGPEAAAAARKRASGPEAAAARVQEQKALNAQMGELASAAEAKVDTARAKLALAKRTVSYAAAMVSTAWRGTSDWRRSIASTGCIQCAESHCSI